MILLRYVAPLDQVDAQMAAHVAWLEKGYDAGIFIVSGRRAPRTGGVILSRGHRQDVEALVAYDPFIISGVAEAEVIEFGANMAADRFAALLI
ncbi:YciI family protein [Sphingomonas sp.]|uniref:YciI family protein n=1 Tax=Sphingomonas sp. TaxID=28214 RepID=UPI003D6D03F6